MKNRVTGNRVTGNTGNCASEGLILGVGVDLCLISRIGDVLEKHGERFLERVFTDEERRYAETLHGATRLGGYAKRWAAKEACAKALGTGFAQGVTFKDIEVGRGESGAPCLNLTGGAQNALDRLTGPACGAKLFVSLSDDAPFALAQVLIQAVSPRALSLRAMRGGAERGAGRAMESRKTRRRFLG